MNNVQAVDTAMIEGLLAQAQAAPRQRVDFHLKLSHFGG
jgi:hypothetical protein